MDFELDNMQGIDFIPEKLLFMLLVLNYAPLLYRSR